MKKIKLHGKYAVGEYTHALVDDEYYHWLDKYYWIAHKSGSGGMIYAVADIWTSSDKQQFRMHRFIMNANTNKLVDHIDGNTVNNQENNLRLATHTENGQNKHVSKFKGVSYDTRYNVWWGRIRVNGTVMGLGTYDTETDCAIAYNHAALKHFGEFASFNRIPNWRKSNPKKHVKNKYIYKSNTSGVPGVSWNITNKCWNVSIGLKNVGVEVQGKRKSLYIGSYKNKLDAIKARRNAEIQYLGSSDIDLTKFTP